MTDSNVTAAPVPRPTILDVTPPETPPAEPRTETHDWLFVGYSYTPKPNSPAVEKCATDASEVPAFVDMLLTRREAEALYPILFLNPALAEDFLEIGAPKVVGWWKAREPSKRWADDHVLLANAREQLGRLLYTPGEHEGQWSYVTFEKEPDRATTKGSFDLGYDTGTAVTAGGLKLAEALDYWVMSELAEKWEEWLTERTPAELRKMIDRCSTVLREEHDEDYVQVDTSSKVWEIVTAAYKDLDQRRTAYRQAQREGTAGAFSDPDADIVGDAHWAAQRITRELIGSHAESPEPEDRPPRKLARRMAAKVKEMTLEDACAVVVRDALRKSELLSARTKVKRVRRAGGRGQDSVIRETYARVEAELEQTG